MNMSECLDVPFVGEKKVFSRRYEIIFDFGVIYICSDSVHGLFE